MSLSLSALRRSETSSEVVEVKRAKLTKLLQCAKSGITASEALKEQFCQLRTRQDDGQTAAKDTMIRLEVAQLELERCCTRNSTTPTPVKSAPEKSNETAVLEQEMEEQRRELQEARETIVSLQKDVQLARDRISKSSLSRSLESTLAARSIDLRLKAKLSSIKLAHHDPSTTPSTATRSTLFTSPYPQTPVRSDMTERRSEGDNEIDSIVQKLTRRLDSLQTEVDTLSDDKSKNSALIFNLNSQLDDSKMAISAYQLRIEELEASLKNSQQAAASERQRESAADEGLVAKELARRINLLEVMMRADQDEKMEKKTKLQAVVRDVFGAISSKSQASFKQHGNLLFHLLDMPLPTQPLSLTGLTLTRTLDKENRLPNDYIGINIVKPLSPMNR